MNRLPTFVLIVALIIAGLSPATASVLDDHILILPPYVNDGEPQPVGELWRTLHRGYSEGIVDVEVIPTERVIAAMEGDTLTFDLFALGEAMEWGQRLESDFVIMAEARDGQVLIQRLDPWTGELFGPEGAVHPFDAIRDLESERWVYGRNLRVPPQDYQPPQLAGANAKLTTWLHENHEFPQDALIELKGCSARVAVTVSPEGVPKDIRIYSVDLPDYGFEEAIAKALWSMRFEPAKRGDNVVHGMWISSVDISPHL